jgi:DNA-binding LacI/PurR family transcriptional regulator
MWRALILLRGETLVNTKRNGTIIAGAAKVAVPSMEPQGFVWERLKARVGREILSGEFSRRESAIASKLALHYNVSINTLKKALVSLVSEGLLTIQGRTYCVGVSHGRKDPPAIVLVSRGTTESGIAIDHLRTEQVVDALERECLRLGFAARPEGFDSNSAKGLLQLSAAIDKVSDPAGFIVNFWNPWSELGWQRCFDMLRLVVDKKLPVLLIDNDGTTTFPESLFKRNNFRVMRIAAVRAGEQMADFLIRSNHRRVAYVTPFMNSNWARERYTGLCKHYRLYGGAKSEVRMCTYDTSDNTDIQGLTLSLLGLSERELRSFYKGRLTTQELQAHVDKLRSVTNRSTIAEDTKGIAVRTIQQFSKLMTQVAREENDPATYRQMLDRFIQIASATAHGQHSSALFAEAIAKTDCTAWVCPDDNTAIHALPFLKKWGKKVPTDISLVAFDNSLPARELHLSSFDFNMAGMVQQALMMIRDPREFKKSLPAYVKSTATSSNVGRVDLRGDFLWRPASAGPLLLRRLHYATHPFRPLSRERGETEVKRGGVS